MERLSNKPNKPMSVHIYWSQMVSPYPKWVFDFISVHGDLGGPYRLVSPLCLVNGNRPAFEQEKFFNKRDAIKRAIELAKEHGLFVLDASFSLESAEGVQS